MRDKKKDTHKLIAGWREWVQLPELGIERIKVKLDTGARTSSIHAFDLSPFTSEGDAWLKFDIHPLQDNDVFIKTCVCPIIDCRWITSSTGHSQRRFIIRTPIKIGELVWPIEISLANRDEMGFRMLLGRTALQKKLLVDPAHSFLLSKYLKPQ